jgi:glycerophosphoryl diester phosphodiesterase
VRPIQAAHRGASAYAPENTLAATALAVALGCDLVEVDLQRSRDGVLVLLHDTTLARTTDAQQVFPDRAPWRVGDFTHAELLTLDAGSWRGEIFAGERIPTLAQVVEQLTGSDTGLLLEVKAPHLHPGIERDLAAELDRHRGFAHQAAAHGRLVVQSFDWEVMRAFKELQPAVPVGLLGAPDARDLPELARWARQVNPEFRDCTSDYVAQLHDHGLDVLTWTVDDPARIRAALDSGVDGVITNRPDVLAAVLRERMSAAA